MNEKAEYAIFKAELKPDIGGAFLLLERFEDRRSVGHGPTNLKIINRFIWLVDYQGKLLFREGRQIGYPFQVSTIAGQNLFEVQRTASHRSIHLWLHKNREALGLNLFGVNEIMCCTWEKASDTDLCELASQEIIPENEFFIDKIQSGALKGQLGECFKQAALTAEHRQRNGGGVEMKIPLFENKLE